MKIDINDYQLEIADAEDAVADCSEYARRAKAHKNAALTHSENALDFADNPPCDAYKKHFYDEVAYSANQTIIGTLEAVCAFNLATDVYDYHSRDINVNSKFEFLEKLKPSERFPLFNFVFWHPLLACSI